MIITARILSDTAFKQALLDSAGSPLCDPDEPVYATALTSARKMCGTKATQLAYMDHPPHACNTWTGAFVIGPDAAAL